MPSRFRVFVSSWLIIVVAAVVAAVQETAPFVTLVDVTAQTGIDFRHENSPTTRKYLIETMGGGVAVFDYDNDGWLDVLFTNGAPLADPMAPDARPVKTEPFANRLYRNNRNGTFTDVTKASGIGGVGTGYGMGVAVGDFDNDGNEDVYITGYDANTLYRNDGHGHFRDVTAKAGVAAGGCPRRSSITTTTAGSI
jgi:hypothetical protein